MNRLAWIPIMAACFMSHLEAQLPSPAGPISAPPTRSQALPAVGSAFGKSASFDGSIPTGAATSDVLTLSRDDAISRGLKYNIGVVSSDQDVRSSRAARLQALSQLLPNVTSSISETRQQVNLAAFGFTSLPGIPQIIGPFNIFDARANLTQSVLDFQAINNRRAADETVKAAQLSFRDVQDSVVFAAVSLYLQAIAGAARIADAQSQVTTSQALNNLAIDQRKAGVIPAIDVLRAQVELQSQQQRLIYYQNEFEKQKLNLSRAIGLPLGQKFRLSDQVPYAPLQAMTLEQALDQAFKTRADYQSAQALVRGAERSREAARSQRLPSVDFNANYGDIGTSLDKSHGTFAVSGAVKIPIYQGGRVRADVEQADAQLQQRRAEVEDLRGRIDNEIRAAFLDLKSSEDQLHLAQSSIELAGQQLQQSQDRFAAGVTNNIEVVQAQESVVSNDDNYISSLYSYNLAKASLARALGLNAEASKQFLGGTK
jgi:outer membrane protein TolC